MNFSLKIFQFKPSSAKTLIISYIGMKTEEVAIAPKVVVTLKNDARAIDEVVVVAYGTAKKSSLTGAVSSVSSKAIEMRPVSSVAGVLEGQAAGIQVNNTYGQPGSDPTIRIRGFSSVNGSNDPLYVLDGVPFGGNISDLNANDIESISVLKDAASSALFGNRASNGVILITTKRGRSERLSVSATVNQGIYNRGIKEYDRMGADDFMETMWTGYRNSLMTSQAAKYPTEALANAQASKTLVTDLLKYNIYNKGNEELFDSNGKLVAGAQVLDGYAGDLDWYEGIERLGHRQDYSINADAATDKANYFFSLGYLDEKGYVKTSDFQRFNARANVNITPRKWFKTGLTLAASHQISNSTAGSTGDASSFVNPFYFSRNMAPIYPVHLHKANGDYALDENGSQQYDDGSEYLRPQNVDRHVIWENELGLDRTYRTTLQGQAYATVNFLKDFSFTVKGDLNLRNSENQTYDSPIIGNGKGNGGRAKRVMYRYKNYTFQQQLSWERGFGKHHVDALLGHENYSYNYSYQYGYKTTETFSGNTELVNFTNITSLTGYQNDYRTESYLSRARYNYDSKYFAEASFRRDGSSRFHPDNRWGNFWSVGGSWMISQEKFMESTQKAINSLKLRASYGEVGNDAGVGYYGYMALYGMTQNSNLGAAYKTQNDAYDIKWETSSSFGVALEGRFYDRVNLSLEYFDKRSQDLLFDVQLPLSAGATSATSASATVSKNLGSISNRGFEITMDVDAIQTKDWRWNIGLNATFLKNKILKLPEQNRKEGIISGTKKYVEGRSIYDFWMYQFVGVDQMTGDCLYQPDLDKYYVGEEVDGKSPIPAESLVKIGDTYYTNFTTYARKDWSGTVIPKVNGSISTTLNYKNLAFSVLMTYALGGKTIDYSYQSLMSVTSNPSALHNDLLNSWSGVPGGMTENSPNRIDPNGIPAIDFDRSSKNNATSSRFLIDGSYLVIKNVNLSYTFPKNFVRKMELNGLSVNASIENLATFTHLQGMNPQQSFAGTNDNAFVTARVFSLGVNIKL